MSWWLTRLVDLGLLSVLGTILYLALSHRFKKEVAAFTEEKREQMRRSGMHHNDQYELAKDLTARIVQFERLRESLCGEVHASEANYFNESTVTRLNKVWEAEHALGRWAFDLIHFAKDHELMLPSGFSLRLNATLRECGWEFGSQMRQTFQLRVDKREPEREYPDESLPEEFIQIKEELREILRKGEN